MTASFGGEAGLPKFIEEMEKLMDTVQEVAGSNKVRFVLVGPTPHEQHPAPLPQVADRPAQLKRYSEALRELAARRKERFVEMLSWLAPTNGPRGAPLLTDNGIHFTEYGYRRAAEIIAIGLGWDAPMWRVGVTRDGQVRTGSHGTRVLEVSRTNDRVKLKLLDEQLPTPPAPGTNYLPMLSPVSRIQVQQVQATNHDLFIDGQYSRTVTERDLLAGLFMTRGPQWDKAELVRQAIVKKNELFFHRYRPQNNTYLFLFRKHEQGQNAREIPEFDPLIAQQEQKISILRRPVPHTYEIVPSSGTNKPAAPVARKPATVPAATPLPQPKFDVEAGLEISLWAENPLLAKPIHMNFDAQGRLWVASSEVYPQIQPGKDATDKILVLQDADGDGRAEKSQVFADGLLIPTGVAPGDGGVYVGQSTELLHLKDTDGDGVADQRRVVLSGFGTEDTHHILHTLRWGHDGQLYMHQSIYIHSHIETPHGIVRCNSGGVLTLRPGTMEVGIHMKGLVNSWGLAFDRFGQSFATDGAGGAGINWVVPQGMYVTYEKARRILDSVSPGAYPKFCGLELIHSSHFPPDWQGNFVTCDFRAHRIVRFGIEEKESGYVTREKPDLVRTPDVAFRPIDVKLGPDGALYIADWSNPIIQHGEVDFRDPRRDHERGRIWRVSAKGRPPAARFVRDAQRPEALLEQLQSADDFTRQQARRALAEAPKSNALPPLRAWTAAQTNDAARLEALWLFQALDEVNAPLLEALLESREPAVRAAAVRVLAFWQERLSLDPLQLASASRGWPPAPLPLPHRSEIGASRALTLLAARVADEHPRVRLEAVRALARLPQPRAVELAFGALDKPMDKFLDYALWLTVNDLADVWIAAIQSGAWKPDGREKHLEFGLKAIEPAQASKVLGQLLGDQPLARDGAGPWIDLIGQAGTAKELRRLFDQILQSGFDDGATARALAALNQAARLRNARPSGDRASLGGLFGHASERVRIESVRLAGAWKEAGPHFARLAEFAGGKDTPAALREAAFGALRDIGGRGAMDTLLTLVTERQPADIRRQAALALAALNLDLALPSAIELLNKTTVEAEALDIWRSLLSNKGAARAIGRALPKTGLSPLMARAGLRAAREGGRNEPELVLALSRGADLDQGEITLTETELKQLAADVLKKGDAARGELVYRRKELSCIACHAIGGAGGKVGPDMTSLGASAPVDYVIESVWFPNKKIKEGYHALAVETKDGRELTGTLARESAEQLVLRDASNQEITLAKNNIAERRNSTYSLMPAGLIDGLTPQERIDLFRFLSELGKPGPFDASKGHVARAWKLRPGLHVEEQKSGGDLPFTDLSGKEWVNAVSNVDGHVPAEALREGAVVANKYAGIVAVYAAARLELAKAGPVRLKLAGADGAGVWIDGKAASGTGEIAADLGAGAHTVVLRLDPKKLPDALRLETSEGTFTNP
jgi:putative heme-binding domain-containing protein